ncbi:MAG: murein biosynthesis integral membrane protein MurJ [Patescibacteria group bacterium]|jgi:putative peptidoglycan lipid II flippase
MLYSWWQRLSGSVTGAAVIIGAASIVSRALGLLRDNLMVKYVPSSELGVYLAAFKIPDLIFNIVVLGALSASFIPVFIAVKKKHDTTTAFTLANSVLNILLVVVTIGIGFGLLLAPQISKLLMRTHPEQQILTAQMLRVMLVCVWFFTVSNVMAGMLNAMRRFLAYSLAPILYNIGIIIGAIGFYPRFGLMGLAYGVVLGAFFHCVAQWVAAWHSGYRYQWIFCLNVTGVKKIFQLMPPRALSLGIMQLTSFVLSIFVLGFNTNYLTNWTYADNLFNVPINVIGVSLALSSFPVFSQALADNDFAKFKELFSNNIRRILFVIIPLSIVMLLLRAQLVRLLFASLGKTLFSWQDTIITAQILGVFSLSLFAQATIPLMTRVFFAHHNTKTPVYVSMAQLVLNVSLAWILSGTTLGLYGIALAYSISNIIAMLILLCILRVKYGDLDDKRIISSIAKIVAASSAMGLVIHGIRYLVAPYVDMHTTLGLFIQTTTSLAAGGFIYVTLAMYYKFEEADLIKVYVKKIWRVLN